MTYPTSFNTKTPEGRKALAFTDIHWRILASSLGVPFDSPLTKPQLCHMAAERGLRVVDLMGLPVPERK